MRKRERLFYAICRSGSRSRQPWAAVTRCYAVTRAGECRARSTAPRRRSRCPAIEVFASGQRQPASRPGIDILRIHRFLRSRLISSLPVNRICTTEPASHNWHGARGSRWAPDARRQRIAAPGGSRATVFPPAGGKYDVGLRETEGQVRSGLPAGASRIRTCMGLFLSSGCFGFC